MKTFYVINWSGTDPKYPVGHLAEKLADFTNTAMKFSSIKRQQITKVAITPGETASAIQLAISNDFLFTLKISTTQESNFLELYEAYKVVQEKGRFIDFVLSSAHPIGHAISVYERLEQQRTQKAVDTKMRKDLTLNMERFMINAPKFFLGEMKYYMQFIPNRCRISVRYAHFWY